MKLYTNPFSPNARKALAVIAELGLEVELHTVDLRGGEQRSPEYLALNPNGKVPTLVDGDTVMWESNAILCYLAGKNENELWPKSPKRYDILRWMFWDSNHLNRAALKLFGQKFFSRGNPNMKIIESANKEFRRHATVLDGQLADNTFITGDTLTLADFVIGANFAYQQVLELPVDGLDNIARWWSELATRESIQEMIPG